MSVKSFRRALLLTPLVLVGLLLLAPDSVDPERTPGPGDRVDPDSPADDEVAPEEELGLEPR